MFWDQLAFIMSADIHIWHKRILADASTFIHLGSNLSSAGRLLYQLC